MARINVSIDTINRYSLTKRTKELLAVAIWIKMNHSNSIMWDVTPGRLRKLLHIGKVKAERIYKDMKECDLFTFEGNTVRVASFRDKGVKRTKDGREYHGAMVYKFYSKDDYTLRDIYNLINEKLFEFQICAAEHNKKNCSMNDEKSQLGVNGGSAITIKQFSNALNMSMSSAENIKKRLVASGKITQTDAKMHSFDKRNEKERRYILNKFGRKAETFALGVLGFVVTSCLYTINDRNVSDSFTHLIYGKQAEKVLQAEKTTVACLPDGFYA